MTDWHKYSHDLLDWVIRQTEKGTFTSEQKKFLQGDKLKDPLADALRLVEVPRT